MAAPECIIRTDTHFVIKKKKSAVKHAAFQSSFSGTINFDVSFILVFTKKNKTKTKAWFKAQTP